MREYKTETVTKTKQIISHITCDICGNRYSYDDKQRDIFEIQEFHFVHFRGGYGSVFGDDSDIECDICQCCLFKLIGKYCRVDGEKMVF